MRIVEARKGDGMFEPLRIWEKLRSAGVFGPAGDKPDWADRRVDTRHDFTGRDVRLRLGRFEYRMHLKDLSCSGASGLTDAPLRVGQSVYLEIDKDNHAWAEVRWTKRAFVGLAFEEPVAAAIVRLLRLRYHNDKYRAPGRQYLPRTSRRPRDGGPGRG